MQHAVGPKIKKEATMLSSDRQNADDLTALQRLGAVLVPAIVVALILVAGAVIFWQTRPSPDERSAPDVPMAGRAPVAANESADWLKRAGDALNERRLISPAGDNAIEFYLRAADEPALEVAARQALLELISPAVSEVRATIAAGEWEEAEREIKLLQQMDVSELRLSDIRRALADARAAEAAATSQTTETQPQVPETAESVATPVDAQPIPRDAAPAEPRPVLPRPTAAPVAAAPESEAEAESEAESEAEAAPQPVPEPPTTRTGPVVVEPVQVADAKPAYPPAAARRRIEGVVELEFTIGVDGSLSDVQIVRSEPPGVFDREAMRAAMRWRFKPKTIDGEPTETRGRKSLSFRLGAG